jgi:hypothetical protein
MTPVAMDRKSTVGVSGAWMALTAWTDPGDDPAKTRLWIASPVASFFCTSSTLAELELHVVN